MEKKIRLDVVIFLLVSAIILTALTTTIVINKRVSSLSEIQSTFSKLKNLDELVKEHYIGILDSEELSDNVARGYVRGMGDEYAQYFTKAEYKDYMSQITGEYEGVGLSVVWMEGEGMFVTAVSKGSPAEESGVQVGDLIVEVEGEGPDTLTYDEMVTRMSGEVGTLVSFKVRRGGEEIDFEILRREFEEVTVDYQLLGHIGYVKITGFNNLTPKYFEQAIDDLTARGVTAYIFDVRGNGGGTIDSVVDCLDRLIIKGTTVATAERKYDSSQAAGSNKTVYQTETAAEVNLPMIVLVDGNTASGGELFAAALRDIKEAPLIGSVTFGKGTGQSTYKLPDGSYIKMTDFSYTPPSGISYNNIGLIPVDVIELTDEQQQDLYTMDLKDDPHILKAFERLGVDPGVMDGGYAEIDPNYSGSSSSSSGASESESSGSESSAA